MEDFAFSAALDVSGQAVLSCQMPADAYISEEALQVVWPEGLSAAELSKNGINESEGERHYVNGSSLQYSLSRSPEQTEQLTVIFQGCTGEQCFFPKTVTIPFDRQFHSGSVKGQAATSEDSSPLQKYLRGYHVSREFSGYKGAADFQVWLQKGLQESQQEDNIVLRVARRQGLWLAALLLIPLGLMLNLTPCVLPLIPISLAIIGVQTSLAKNEDGNQRSQQRRGAGLGALYGLAQMLVYGALGAVAVLTGGRFGSINDSSWMNWGIAVCFILFALAMFDVFTIDFTRFRPHCRITSQSGWLTALLMGAVSALMASACVAPVLLAVLVLTADLFAEGHYFAIAMPWLLGLGLALPWPFLGAGIARCPRPGKWMMTVKRMLGALILLLGIYYAHLGFSLRFSNNGDDLPDGWRTSMQELASVSPKAPVLLYFSGRSCKSCALLKRHTFQDDKVQEALKDILKIELNDDIEAGELFNIRGYPTCILLMPDHLNQKENVSIQNVLSFINHDETQIHTKESIRRR